MTKHRLTLPEDRAFAAFNAHRNPGSVGQLLAAIHAYRDCLMELGYLDGGPNGIRGAVPDPFVDAAERAALAATLPSDLTPCDVKALFSLPDDDDTMHSEQR